MPNVAQGATASYTFPTAQTVTFTLDQGERAVINVTRSGSLIANRSISNGETVGPYQSGDVMAVTALRGAVDYDVATYTAPVSGDGVLLRRPMLRQLHAQGAYSTIAPGGATVTQTAPPSTYAPRAFAVTATATGASAVRGCVAATFTGLDTTAYYMAVIDITAMSNQSASDWGGWLGTSSTYSEITAGATFGFLRWSVQKPVVGLNAVIIRPSTSTMVIRAGIGCDNTAGGTTGDFMQVASMSLYRVAGLTEAPFPYANGLAGVVGYDATRQTRLAADCVYVTGDSWSNDTTDWPALLASTYGREVVAVATGGHYLSQMLTATQGAMASTAALYAPNRNAPGVYIIAGGINSVVNDVSSTTMISQHRQHVAQATSRGMVPMSFIQPLCTNSSYYTTARAAAWADFAQYIYDSGAPFVDLRGLLQNADGTANTTLMADEAGLWIHPTAAGHAAVARAVNDELRNLDLAGVIGRGVWTP